MEWRKTVPPLANPVALKQYLDYPSAAAYDPHSKDNSWRNGRHQRASHRRYFSEIRLPFDPQGNLSIADGAFWKITPDDEIVSFASYGNSLFEMGTFSLAIGASGNLFSAGLDSGTVMKSSTASQKWNSFVLVSPLDIVYSLAVSGSITPEFVPPAPRQKGSQAR